MKNNHTAGEWKVKHSESKDAFNIVGTKLGGKYKIARCPYLQIEGSPELSEREKDETEANAKLIAASPELLKLVQMAVEYWDSDLSQAEKIIKNQMIAVLHKIKMK